jgi:hypothetical protein
MRMRHIVTCGVPGSTFFFSRYLKQGTIFEKRVVENRMFVLISSTTFA